MVSLHKIYHFIFRLHDCNNYYCLSETSDLGRTTSTGTTLKVGSKIGKSTGPADRASRHGTRAGASVCFYVVE